MINLENVPYALAMTTYSDLVGCDILKISMRASFSGVSFRVSVVFMTFRLEDLSLDEIGVLEAAALIDSHPVLLLHLLVFVVCIGVFPCWGMYVDECSDPLLKWMLSPLYSVLLCRDLWPSFPSLFLSGISIATSAFLSVPFT